MRLRFTYLVALSATLALLCGAQASAQRYPERRTTRRGTQLYNRGDYTGAEEMYRHAMKLNPELREAGYNLGGALWRQAQGAAREGMSEEEQKAVQARMEDAAKAWEAIVADSLAAPRLRSAAGYNAGNVALAAEQLDAAIEAYKGALRLRPDDMEAKYNLAYAQLLKRRQEQNDDQNKDENKDDNGGGGGGGDQQDPQSDQNRDDQNKDQNDPEQGDGDKEKNDGDGQNNGQNNGQNDGQNDGQNGPRDNKDGQGGGKPKIDPRAAEQMLDAMQAAEDDTREKVEGRKVQAGSHSGKNW